MNASKQSLRKSRASAVPNSLLWYCDAIRDYRAVNSSTALRGASSPKKRRWFVAVWSANEAPRGKSAQLKPGFTVSRELSLADAKPPAAVT